MLQFYEIKITVKVVFPSFDLKWIFPLWASTILLVSVKPIPEPFFLVVKYGIKILSFIASGIPTPLSVKVILTLLFSSSSLIVMIRFSLMVVKKMWA